MTSDIIRLLHSLSAGLTANQLLNQFDFGQFGDYDGVSIGRSYPLMFVEYPSSYSLLSNQIRQYRLAITLLDQPKPLGPAVTKRDLAYLKTRLELTWATFWELCIAHYSNKILNLQRLNTWIDLSSGYQAVEVDLTQGDGVYGYRYEIVVNTTLSGCDLRTLIADFDTLEDLCLTSV